MGWLAKPRVRKTSVGGFFKRNRWAAVSPAIGCSTPLSEESARNDRKRRRWGQNGLILMTSNTEAIIPAMPTILEQKTGTSGLDSFTSQKRGKPIVIWFSVGQLPECELIPSSGEKTVVDQDSDPGCQPRQGGSGRKVLILCDTKVTRQHLLFIPGIASIPTDKSDSRGTQTLPLFFRHSPKIPDQRQSDLSICNFHHFSPWLASVTLSSPCLSCFVRKQLKWSSPPSLMKTRQETDGSYPRCHSASLVTKDDAGGVNEYLDYFHFYHNYLFVWRMVISCAGFGSLFNWFMFIDWDWNLGSEFLGEQWRVTEGKVQNLGSLPTTACNERQLFALCV